MIDRPPSPHTTIAVVGAGPAGSTLATRLAQLGHDVTLIEGARFPRPHLGESLSPGVSRLLPAIGAEAVLEAAGATPVHAVDVLWGRRRDVRTDSDGAGHIVDRGRFDQQVLERARAAGVRVSQPVRVRSIRQERWGWTLALASGGCVAPLHATFLADATGRAHGMAGGSHTMPSRTLAVYAYWRGAGLPERPGIEAGTDGWYWAVPLPDGTCNTLAFVDLARSPGERATSAPVRFETALAQSVMFARCRRATLVGRVRAVDATPWLATEPVTPSSIRVGDAALALDPLSSTGVQKAMQTALAGAVVVNTLLRQPGQRETALQFYRAMVADASARHHRWAATSYAEMCALVDRPFWRERAGLSAGLVDRSTALGLSTVPESASPDLSEDASTGAMLMVSPEVRIVDKPCLDDQFVSVRPALEHPALDGPIAYVGGVEVAPVVRGIPAGLTAMQIAATCVPGVPAHRALALVMWLLSHRVLVPIAG